MSILDRISRASAPVMIFWFRGRFVAFAMFPSCYSKHKNGAYTNTPVTKVVAGVFAVYMLHICWVLYGFVYTKACNTSKSDNCITPYLSKHARVSERNHPLHALHTVSTFSCWWAFMFPPKAQHFFNSRSRGREGTQPDTSAGWLWFLLKIWEVMVINGHLINHIGLYGHILWNDRLQVIYVFHSTGLCQTMTTTHQQCF